MTLETPLLPKSQENRPARAAAQAAQAAHPLKKPWEDMGHLGIDGAYISGKIIADFP